MQSPHVHTTLAITDYREAREKLSRQLRVTFMLDIAVFVVMSGLLAMGLAISLEGSDPKRLQLFRALPFVLFGFGLLWAVLRFLRLAIPGRRRLVQLEARTLAGESVSCAEFEEPSPIRMPRWLK